MTALAVLNPAALVTLADCEQRIERGLKTFIDVGQALAEIRDSRLYKGSHDTFEDYLEGRWGMSRAHAYRMISAAEVVSPMGDIDAPPTNERQTRELAKVPESERAEVWREAVERTNGKPTAAAVREVHTERTTPTPGPSGAAVTPPVDPGVTPAPATEPPRPPAPSREPDPEPPTAQPSQAFADMEAAERADSVRRVRVRNLTSVLTFLTPLAITPAELAEREYGPVLDQFEQDDLERALETLTTIVSLKRGM